MVRTIKVALIGSSGTGKTSLRGQFISGQFSTNYRATIGADFIAKTIHLSHEGPLAESSLSHLDGAASSSAAGLDGQSRTPDEGEAVTLQIWDTAGQERFSALSSAFFRGADAAIIVYDVRRPKSLSEVAMWWRAFADKCPVAPEDEATWPVVVVGNKIDLLDQVENPEDAVWRREEAKAFVSRLIAGSGEESADVQSSRGRDETLPRAVPEESSKAVSITINGHTLNGSSNGYTSRVDGLYPTNATFSSNRTGNTIFHTPSSSFHESDRFHSAASSFYSDSSPAHSRSTSRATTRSGRRLTIDTVSSSSATITPSLYARGDPAQAEAPPRTPSIRHPSPVPPERGPKLLFASAKTGEGVSEVFNYIARRAVHRLEWIEANLPFGEDTLPGPALDDQPSLAQFGTLTGRCC